MLTDHALSHRLHLCLEKRVALSHLLTLKQVRGSEGQVLELWTRVFQSFTSLTRTRVMTMST